MSTNGFPAGAEPDKSPWTQPRFVSAAVIVALVAVLGVVLVLSGSSDNTDSPAPTPPPGVASAPKSPAPDASSCALRPGDQTVPTGAPGKTRWELAGRMIVPTAPTQYGPGRVSNGLRTCFAKSPLGALYAGVNVVAMLSIADEQQAALEQLAADTPSRKRALKKLRRDGASADPQTKLQVAGFSFVDYEASRAELDLLFRVDTGKRVANVHLTLTLRWQGGDWKLVIARNGRPFDSLGVVGDPSAYTAWSGA